MKTIKAYIGWNDTNHTHYYKELEMVKNYLEKDSASCDYNYTINFED